MKPVTEEARVIQDITDIVEGMEPEDCKALALEIVEFAPTIRCGEFYELLQLALPKLERDQDWHFPSYRKVGLTNMIKHNKQEYAYSEWVKECVKRLLTPYKRAKLRKDLRAFLVEKGKAKSE